jgi:hypothetical protein
MIPAYLFIGDRTSGIIRHHLSYLLGRLFKLSRDETPDGSLSTLVEPLSCGVMLRVAQLLSTPLRRCAKGFRFFHHPMPADPSASLAARFPNRETYGFTTVCTELVEVFRTSNHTG